MLIQSFEKVKSIARLRDEHQLCKQTVETDSRFPFLIPTGSEFKSNRILLWKLHHPSVVYVCVCVCVWASGGDPHNRQFTSWHLPTLVA